MARSENGSRPGAHISDTHGPGEAGFFSRCSELAIRFRKEALNARDDGRCDTAAQFQRVALLLEELERRNVAEALTARFDIDVPKPFPSPPHTREDR